MSAIIETQHRVEQGNWRPTDGDDILRAVVTDREGRALAVVDEGLAHRTLAHRSGYIAHYERNWVAAELGDVLLKVVHRLSDTPQAVAFIPQEIDEDTGLLRDIRSGTVEFPLVRLGDLAFGWQQQLRDELHQSWRHAEDADRTVQRMQAEAAALRLQLQEAGVRLLDTEAAAQQATAAREAEADEWRMRHGQLADEHSHLAAHEAELASLTAEQTHQLQQLRAEAAQLVAARDEACEASDKWQSTARAADEALEELRGRSILQDEALQASAERETGLRRIAVELEARLETLGRQAADDAAAHAIERTVAAEQAAAHAASLDEALSEAAELRALLAAAEQTATTASDQADALQGQLAERDALLDTRQTTIEQQLEALSGLRAELNEARGELALQGLLPERLHAGLDSLLARLAAQSGLETAVAEALVLARDVQREAELRGQRLGVALTAQQAETRRLGAALCNVYAVAAAYNSSGWLYRLRNTLILPGPGSNRNVES